jgi:hypothetical protein
MNGLFAFCHSANLGIFLLSLLWVSGGVLVFSDIGMAHCRQVETYNIMI